MTGPGEELTTAEAAALAGVSARSIRAWLAAGHIQAVARLDGRRVTRQSLLAYLAKREGHADAAAAPEAEPEAPPAAVAADPATANAVVVTVLASLAAELEHARQERASNLERISTLSARVGYLEGEEQRWRQLAAAVTEAAQEAIVEASQPVRQPWWRRIFRGGSQ